MVYRKDRRDREPNDRDSRSSHFRRSDERNYDRDRDRNRYQGSNEKRHRSRSKDRKERRRSRSRSHERNSKPSHALSRAERDHNKAEHLRKMGIDIVPQQTPSATNASNGNNNSTNITSSNSNIQMPNIITPPTVSNIHHNNLNLPNTNNTTTITVTSNISSTSPKPPATNNEDGPFDLANFTAPILVSARYTEQMQKRKQLWSHKKNTVTAAVTAAATDPTKAMQPITNNKWETAKFQQDTDGKVQSKFLRLMGMKDAPKVLTDADSSAPPDMIQKQNEMFSSMEHQYEVARQVTHTMRGMGLGFGSQPRQF